ncbi:flagellar motility protein MotE (MotC chaperone) [Caldicoprobacter guelmensis]|uniref:MotE family protein n=1 Tax=Caldicoprobacter guelmensis TaxID=1170224 RepID=UPI001957185B|nr:hypothetical protein [Caldicoprobacter guelmensis]MBM7581381.1 flagellar motility protein MotE (MotC chaperone) [Caldicoprobacter guelmensis]
MAGHEEVIREVFYSKRGAVWPFILGLVLFVITAIGLLFFFNVGGIRDVVVRLAFHSKAVSNQQSEGNLKLQQQLKAIEEEKSRLKDFENQLNALKSELEGKQQELEQREIKLQQKEKEIEELQQRLSSQFENIRDIAKVYENMEPEQAASILSQMEDSSLVIQILRNLSKEKSGEILGAMDSKKAAELTRQMAGE